MSVVFRTPIARTFAATSGYGADRSYRGAGAWHEGLDFPAPIGTPVLAAANGVVVRAVKQEVDPAGWWVAIQHADGWVSRYMHLSRIDVAVGQPIRAGTMLGAVGKTGIDGAPHLHFDLKLAPERLAWYATTFGKPANGWGRDTALGTGVPAEPLIPAVYAVAVQTSARRLGIPIYRASFSSGRGRAIAIGAGFVVGGLGLAWMLQRALR